MNFVKRNKYKVGVLVAVLVIIAIAVLSGGGSKESLQTEKLSVQDIERTVLATGTVTSNVDLSLGFKASGIVKKIPARVGQKVKAGDVLAQLDSLDQSASVTQARGTVAQARAAYDKVLSGASSEDVAVAQVAVANAEQSLQNTKTQQAGLVKNAKHTLFNSSLEAVPLPGNISALRGSATMVVSGTYDKVTEVVYNIRFYASVSGIQYSVEGPGGLAGQLVYGVPLKMDNYGLFFTITGSLVSSNDSWTVSIPNTQASSYVANLNAYNASLQAQTSAVSTAENVLNSAIASLNLKKAQARPADVASAEAGLLSAQGQLQGALAQLENTIIRAPADGTITLVDIKIGEQATALKPVITLQDVGSLYVEANISEANVAQVKLEQPVKFTFDALGVEREFTGKLLTVDPASTVVSGVVNYKITASVDQITDIKPGMTANMSVLVGTANKVLAVPSRAIVEHDGKKFVRVITDEKQQTYKEVVVTTGLEADGGLVEIKTGLEAGQTIVTFIETKK